MDEKKINFTQKRVDESWKESVSKEGRTSESRREVPALSFYQFIASLGMQTLTQLGELKVPGQDQSEVNLEAAKETIDLLVLLKEKTKGNLSSEEEALLNSLIPELQLKFVQHKTK